MLEYKLTNRPMKQNRNSSNVSSYIMMTISDRVGISDH